MRAAAVTRIAVQATGVRLFASRLVAPGEVRCTQRYAAVGALTPGDTRARREARAEAAAAALLRAGYVVTRSGDALTVTLPEEAR